MKANITSLIEKKYFKKNKWFISVIILFMTFTTLKAQFVHPGLTNKRSDLDRVKYMVEAQIDPWYSSYQEMVADSKSSYNYTVRGNSTFTELGRDNGTNYSAWNDDIRAAYYNAIMWYVTGDSRHADKSIEIFNAWNNLQDVTSGGTQALSGGIAYIMVEAAEIIKSTYTGWSSSDIQAFKDMLVYPGYSTTAEPSGISRVSGSFYWQAYQGDPVRHGNQGLAGFRAVMAMGIFMDNEIMYDRALRYIQGLTHRSDDLPYPAGPPQATTISFEGDYEDTYNYTVGTSVEDFGYNEVMTNYIYANGQCQESSRDQQHTVFGIGNLCAMAEMAWNQGDDLYSHVNDRLLLGLEYTAKYNVSYLRSYPDQTEWWIPTVASGEFTQRFNASQRVYAKFISPTHVGGFVEVRPVFEMPLAHYEGRGFKTANEVLWTTRARDVSIEESGYEAAGHQNGAIGWGALTSRRPEGCYGEPISGLDSNGLPDYNMNVLPGTIEAENFDYSPVSGQDRTYSETTTANKGGDYRTTEAVDIETCDEGGYNVGWIANNEWLTYTVYVPSTGNYNISLRYASKLSGGTVKVLFGGDDKTGFVNVPSTGDYQVWDDLVLSSSVTLTQGVQSMKILIGTGGFNINNISVNSENLGFVPDPNKTYYIDCPVHNLRVASTGASEDAYTVSSSQTGADVEWKFVDKGNGYWHIDRAAGGSLPRLRTDGSQNADMQGTGWTGTYTYYDFSEGASSGTYYLTLADGPTYKRLQVNSSGLVRMVTTSSAGTWESFTITEASSSNRSVLVKGVEEDNNINHVSIYPNPVTNTLKVFLPDTEFNQYTILDINGKEYVRGGISSEIEGLEIDLSSFSKGIYMLKLNGGQLSRTLKIIKE